MDTQIKLRDFESQVLFFNGMYKLPLAPYPTTYYEASAGAGAEVHIPQAAQTALLNRLSNFKEILLEETNEVDDIIMSLKSGFRYRDLNMVQPKEAYTELDMLTDLADWLGDMSIFCASEMARYGIPLKETLSIIMSSNFSKLGSNGEPLYDKRGKVQKGPGYWKPEPQIKAMLQEHIEERGTAVTRDFSRMIVWRAGE